VVGSSLSQLVRFAIVGVGVRGCGLGGQLLLLLPSFLPCLASPLPSSPVGSCEQGGGGKGDKERGQDRGGKST